MDYAKCKGFMLSLIHLVVFCWLWIGTCESFTAVIVRTAHRRDIGGNVRMGASSSSLDPSRASYGLYRPIAEMIWNKLTDTGSLQAAVFPEHFRSNAAPAKGLSNATVHMQVDALEPRSNDEIDDDSKIHYARVALLETLVSDSEKSLQSRGIQVLNLVIFPNPTTTLPVWGADFVSLPGDKHLLLLDAQPMQGDRSFEQYWSDWYTDNHVTSLFPWGGDMPERVQPYISKHALWTRFGKEDDALPKLQGPLVSLVERHLDVYLDLLRKHAVPSLQSGTRVNHQLEYVRYRLENDPARPMLKSLYGEEWTEQVLSKVLFPNVI